MTDPLAQFRKKPVVPVGQPTTTSRGDDYIAFDAKDRVERLQIRCANAPTRAPGYGLLLDVAYDGTFGTNFVLSFTFMQVLVRGRNLQTVIAALEMSTAAFIQEFDPKRWERPKDRTLPIIESIEVIAERETSASHQGDNTVH